MFENDTVTVDSLLNENSGFKRLYDKYHLLKDKIQAENKRNNNADQIALEKLKKEKLTLKDQMASMIQDYKNQQA